MRAVQVFLLVAVALFPACAQAGFVTGAVAGAVAGRVSCMPYQKELACIKARLKDPAWKGHEDQIIPACEPKKKEPSATQQEPQPQAQPQIQPAQQPPAVSR